MRKLLKRIVRYPSVREDLNVAAASLGSAVRSWRAENARTRPGSEQHLKLNNLKLNIGCGNLVIDGWENFDAFPVKGARYANVINGIPLGDDAAVHIHCEHFLEHLAYSAAEGFLAECRRVLQPGGSLRIIVPDAEAYLTAYCRNDSAFFERLRHLGNATEPLETRMHIINQMFRMGGGHKFAWDFETLRLACARAGFDRCERSARGGVPAEFNIDGSDPWREWESLYANIYC